MSQCKISTRQGFTIVELLIVIVVIAILAAITVVAYSGITNNAQASKMKSELNTTGKAIMAASVETEKYPGTAPNQTDKLASDSEYNFNYFQRDGGGSFCIDLQNVSSENVQFHFDKDKGSVQTGLCPENTIGSGGPTPGSCFAVEPAGDWVYNEATEEDEWVVSEGVSVGLSGGGRYEQNPGVYNSPWLVSPECLASDGRLVIPSSVGGQTVTRVADGGFNSLGIEAISLPNTLRVIGSSAFSGNIITSVTLPASVVRVGHAAFYVNKINTLSVLGSATVMESLAFRSNELTNVSLSHGVQIYINTYGYASFDSSVVITRY